MTLIIGIKCKDGIVMATDSQITTGTVRETTPAKIEEIVFPDFTALVGQAGGVVLSNRYVDILRGMAAGFHPTRADDVGSLMQRAMLTLRNELREVHFGCTSEELSNILMKEGDGFDILLGCYVAGDQCLIAINLRQPVYQVLRTRHAAIGCGDLLGKYLMTEYVAPEAGAMAAAALAVYFVEAVIRHDAFCGGPARVGLVFPGRDVRGKPGRSWTKFLSAEQVDKFSQDFNRAEMATRAVRTRIVTTAFSLKPETVKTMMARIEKALPAQQSGVTPSPSSPTSLGRPSDQ